MRAHPVGEGGGAHPPAGAPSAPTAIPKIRRKTGTPAPAARRPRLAPLRTLGGLEEGGDRREVVVAERREGRHRRAGARRGGVLQVRDLPVDTPALRRRRAGLR